MSVVTNVVLHVDIGGTKLPLINDYLQQNHHGPLVSIDDPALPRGWYGGEKYFEADLFLGAFSHLDLPALVAFLKQLDWDEAACVQLIVNEQEGVGFRIVEIVRPGV